MNNALCLQILTIDGATMMYPVRHDEAVSETIGAVLLISIVVIAVAIVGTILWSQPVAQKIPSFSASITNASCNVILTHSGGETVTNTEIRLLVNGNDQTANFNMTGTASPWTSWAIGETLVYAPPEPSCALPGQVDIVYRNGDSYSYLSTVYLQPFTVLPSLPRPYTHTITASAGTGGSITPSGTVVVIDGASQLFTITANSLYEIRNISVDGVSQPASSGYTFTNIIADHTISATFGVVPPVASFTGTPLSGTAPLLVTFTDSSLNIPTAWNWSFKNATQAWTQFSTAQNPAFSFPNGTYDINLTATNAGGSNTFTRTGYFTATTPPVADFTGTPLSGTAPLPVTFTDTSSNTPTSWKWEYKNATVGWTEFGSNARNPTFTFPVGRYSINLTATNAGGSGNKTSNNYINASPSPAWYDCNWGRRNIITIDHTKVSADLTSFPVLISLTDANLKSSAKSDGYDILFTKSDGTTKIPHEIESYTSSTGALVAWVQVPSVSSLTDTTVYMYYNNSGAANQQNVNGVWDSNYTGVWHLKENPAGTAPQMLDSTSNANSGTSAGSMIAGNQVAAKINGGLDLDGSNDYIESKNNIGITANAVRTITFWAKLDTTGNQGLVTWGNTALNQKFGGLIWGANNFLWGWGSGNDWDTLTAAATGSWKYHALVNDGTKGRWYVDGTELGSGFAHTYNTADSHAFIGRAIDSSASYYMNGIIDEVRISNTARSAGWILTEYRNQNSPSTFSSLGSQEQWTC